jgi:hypothetical protein
MVNKGCVPVMLAINILISRLGFSKISNMAVNSANEKFASKRYLVHFLVIE